MAYFLHRLARVGEDPRLSGAAQRWAAVAVGGLDRPGAFTGGAPHFPDSRAAIPASLVFGEAGVWCCQAMVAAAHDDPSDVERAVGRFAALAESCPLDRNDAVSGAAGLLLGTAVMMEALGPDAAAGLSAPGGRLAGWLMRLCGRALQTPGSIGWLGAAHGWCGIAHAVLRWCQATETTPGPEVLGLLGTLRDSRLATGLWPRRTDSGEVWPGWCHGSAGWVQLWTLVWEVLGDEDALALAEVAARHAVAFEGGGPGLCCGEAGSGYAAIAMYRATGEDGWLAHARRLAAHASDAVPGGQLPEHSLWQGDLGVALLLAEVEEPSSAAMPLYRRT